MNLKLAVPKEMGENGAGVNPEQLFAAGYCACFMGAMKLVAGKQKIAWPADTSIEATVGFGPFPAGFGIEVQLVVSIPRMEHAAAQSLVEKVNLVCPYSNDTRGNIEGTITVAQ